jgi:predicted TPR repeat methyltransferase
MRPRVAPAFFDRLYAAEPDPWGFETSEYERAKYDATIAALPARPVGKALEIGCSIGVLTARLAERAERVLAVDVSEAALRTARARGIPNVSFERRELPEEMPAGPFGLVVASEVLYYLDPPALDAMLEAIAGVLAPRGSLLAVHWRHPTETYPLLGDEVHARLERRFGAPAHSAPTDDYLLDRFDA